MLKNSEIKELGDRLISAIAPVSQQFTVIDDSDFSLKRQDFNLDPNQVALVFIRPSSSLRGSNQDSLRRNYPFTIMVLQTYTRNDGYEEEDRKVDLAIDVVREIDALVIKWEGTIDCPVKGMTAIGAVAEPIRGYYDTIGATVTYNIRNNA